MIHKGFVIVFIIVAGLIGSSKAQEGGLVSIDILNDQGIFESAFKIRPEGRYREIQGSPYLNPDWKMGQIWLEGDSLPGIFSMRYNVYGNEMQFIVGNDTFAITNPFVVSSIVLDNREFKYLAFDHNGNDNMAYFEVIAEGKYRLLALHKTILNQGKEPLTPYHPQTQNDQFLYVKTYFLQTPDEPNPVKVKDSKKFWATHLHENRTELNAFIRENRIRISRESDLVKLINWKNIKYHGNDEL